MQSAFLTRTLSMPLREEHRRTDAEGRCHFQCQPTRLPCRRRCNQRRCAVAERAARRTREKQAVPGCVTSWRVRKSLAEDNDRGKQSRWSGLLTKRQFAYQVERGRTGLRMEKAVLLILSSAWVGNPIKNVWCCGVHMKGRAFPQAGYSGDSGAWPAPRPARQEHDVEAGFRQPRQLQRRRGVLWWIWW